MKKLLIYLLLAFVSFPGFAQVTRPVVEHRIDSLVPNNATRTITPERLRKAFGVAMDYAKQADTINSKKIVGELDIISGKVAIKAGGVLNTNLRTDSTVKVFRLGLAPWANARNPGAIIYANNALGYSYLNIGGGSSVMEPTTYIQEFTGTPGTTGGTLARFVFPNGFTWFGGSPVNDGINLVTVNGTANVKGTLTTQALEPAQSGTYRIGSSTLNYGTAYVQQLISNSGALNLRVPAASGIYFNQSATVGDATKVIGGFHPNTGEFVLQAPGTVSTNNGARFQNYGTSWLGGDVAIGGVTTSQSITPDSHNSRALGASSANWATIWGVNYLSSVNGTATFGTTLSANNIAFRQGGNNTTVGGFFGATGNFFIQSSGAYPSDNTYKFQNYGSTYLGGNTLITGTLTLNDGTITKITGGNLDFGSQRLATAGSVAISGSVSVFGSGTNDNSAVVTINSTTKGFLPPRMTEAQKNAITSPAEGLLIYQNSGTKGWYGYNGTAWIILN